LDAGRGWTGWSNRSNEAVAAAGESLYEAGVVGGIAEGVSKSFDGSIQPVVKVDEGVDRPEPSPQFLSMDNFSGSLQQHCQELERLVLELDLAAIPAKFRCGQVGLEYSKTDVLAIWGGDWGLWHRYLSKNPGSR
jgi:hypothetical protein